MFKIQQPFYQQYLDDQFQHSLHIVNPEVSLAELLCSFDGSKDCIPKIHKAIPHCTLYLENPSDLNSQDEDISDSDDQQQMINSALETRKLETELEFIVQKLDGQSKLTQQLMSQIAACNESLRIYQGEFQKHKQQQMEQKKQKNNNYCHKIHVNEMKNISIVDSTKNSSILGKNNLNQNLHQLKDQSRSNTGSTRGRECISDHDNSISMTPTLLIDSVHGHSQDTEQLWRQIDTIKVESTKFRPYKKVTPAAEWHCQSKIASQKKQFIRRKLSQKSQQSTLANSNNIGNKPISQWRNLTNKSTQRKSIFSKENTMPQSRIEPRTETASKTTRGCPVVLVDVRGLVSYK